jgi:hypothetical protein
MPLKKLSVVRSERPAMHDPKTGIMLSFIMKNFCPPNAGCPLNVVP